MTYEARLQETLPRIRDTIAGAAARAGRDPSTVVLVAVTKGHPVDAIRAALAAGLTDLGENRIGELESKVAEVGRHPRAADHSGAAEVRWHMIGHLQRRKAPRALEVADLIHAVDSPRLAERISRVAGEAEVADEGVAVLFQVNTSGEDAKYGFPLEGAEDAILEACELPGLDPRGLMTMAPYTDDEAVLRATFRRLRELRDRLRKAEPRLGEELSMGMTNDLELAVEEGSTMVRIGTALFGER